MADTLFLIGIIGYFLLAFLVIKIIRRHVRASHWLLRCLILSFAYGLFFGPGAVGGGGDPGFAMPAPVVIAAWYATKGQLLNNSVFPFLFWWAVVFSFMVTVRAVKLIRKKKAKTPNTDQLPTT